MFVINNARFSHWSKQVLSSQTLLEECKTKKD